MLTEVTETIAAVNISLSEEQENVIKAVLNGENILITGSAGTGKSTLLRELKSRIPETLPVAASTGISAINVSGMTIHSWAGIGLGTDSAAVIAKRLMENKNEAYFRIKNYKRLAIDEISMISGKLFNLLNEVFQIVRKSDAPFGGMQMILIGDFLQLPPVIKRAEDEEQGKFAFESTAWRAAGIKVAMLTRVFRQSDEAFSTALNEIRVGEPSDAARALLNARYRVHDEFSHIEPVLVHTHNVDVDSANADRLAAEPGDSEYFQARDTGRPGPLATLQANCLAPETLELKIGAQVMLLKNVDVPGGLANGSIGKVTEFSKTLKLPTVTFPNGRIFQADFDKFEIKDGGEVLACRSQIPLRLAWAITVHKSQGMTLDKIKVHLANVFEDGQAYVALSRARTAEGLFIQSGSRKNIRANRAAVEFYRTAGKI